MSREDTSFLYSVAIHPEIPSQIIYDLSPRLPIVPSPRRRYKSSESSESSTTTLKAHQRDESTSTNKMFNENFSFVSGSSDPILASANPALSADISPFTSRCSSPHQADFLESRLPRTYRDSRYDSYRPRHQSITALTTQLQSHALSERRSPSCTSDYHDEPSPPESFSADQDEGYFEGPNTPSTTSSEFSADFDPLLYDLLVSDMSATSSPRPSLSLEAQAFSSHSQRRRQRQALIRLQCLAKRAPDLAMLIEECHPSSIPLPSEGAWPVTSRSGSTCSITSGRIEKEGRTSYVAVRKTPKMRKERR